MKTKNRFSAISELTESRIDTVMSDAFYLTSILEDGIKGFNELTNKELEQEYRTEFDEEVKITGE